VIGGSECALAAQEMGYDVFGMDIMEGNVKQAQKYGLNAERIDFINIKQTKNGMLSLWATL